MKKIAAVAMLMVLAGYVTPQCARAREPIKFDFIDAREAGVTEDQIASFVASRVGYDYEGAAKAGATADRITSYLIEKGFAVQWPLGADILAGTAPPLPRTSKVDDFLFGAAHAGAQSAAGRVPIFYDMVGARESGATEEQIASIGAAMVGYRYNIAIRAGATPGGILAYLLDQGFIMPRQFPEECRPPPNVTLQTLPGTTVDEIVPGYTQKTTNFYALMARIQQRCNNQQTLAYVGTHEELVAALERIHRLDIDRADALNQMLPFMEAAAAEIARFSAERTAQRNSELDRLSEHLDRLMENEILRDEIRDDRARDNGRRWP